MGKGLRWLAHDQTCAHEHTKTISTGVITRVVCQDCGHVEIQEATGLSGEVNRSLFERKSEAKEKVDATAAVV